MAKIDLPTIASGYASTSQLNDALQKIEDALNNAVLYRDNPVGEPNSMVDTLDMNSNSIINLPAPINDHEPVRLQDLNAFDFGNVEGIVPTYQPRQTGDGVTTDFSSPATAGSNHSPKSFFVHLDGFKQRPFTDYSYDIATGDIQFVEAPANGTKIDIVFFEPNTIVSAPTAASDITYSGTGGGNVQDKLDSVQAELDDTLHTVATMVNLAALAAPSGFQMVRVANFHNVLEPGGGGDFYWQSNSNEAAVAGMIVIPDGHVGAGRWKRAWDRGEINCRWTGGKADGITDDAPAINLAASHIGTGNVRAGKGSWLVNSKLSFNTSGLNFVGDGADITYIIAGAGLTTTCVEINNGSWDDVTEIYSATGTSIGSASIQNMSIDGAATTGCTGVAFARATLQCHLSGVKITNFDVGARMYGAWYSKVNRSTFQGNNVGMLADYETNDFVLFETEFVSNISAHLEFPGVGTCRKVSMVGGGFDGLPSGFGASFKNIHGLTLRDLYLEVYSTGGAPTTTNFLTFGAGLLSASIKDNNLIGPDDATYEGTFLKMAEGPGAGVNFAEISGNVVHQPSASTFIDTTDGANITVGQNKSGAPSIIDMAAIIPNHENTVSFPELLGTKESRLTVCRTKQAIDIPRVTVTFDTTAALGTGEMRIIRQDTGAVVLNYVLGNVTANVPIDMGSIPAMSYGVVLQAYTYKVGGSIDFPACSVTIEQV